MSPVETGAVFTRQSYEKTAKKGTLMPLFYGFDPIICRNPHFLPQILHKKKENVYLCGQNRPKNLI